MVKCCLVLKNNNSDIVQWFMFSLNSFYDASQLTNRCQLFTYNVFGNINTTVAQCTWTQVSH